MFAAIPNYFYAVFEVTSLATEGKFSIYLLRESRQYVMSLTYIDNVARYSAKDRSLIRAGAQILFTSINGENHWAVEGAPNWDANLWAVLSQQTDEQIELR